MNNMKVVDWRKKKKFDVKDFDDLGEFDIIVVNADIKKFSDMKKFFNVKDIANNDNKTFVAFKDDLLSDVFYKWYQSVLCNLEEYEKKPEELAFMLRNGFPFEGRNLKTYEEACEYLNAFIEEVMSCLPN